MCRVGCSNFTRHDASERPLSSYPRSTAAADDYGKLFADLAVKMIDVNLVQGRLVTTVAAPLWDNSSLPLRHYSCENRQVHNHLELQERIDLLNTRYSYIIELLNVVRRERSRGDPTRRFGEFGYVAQDTWFSEANFDASFQVKWVRRNYFLAPLAAILYLLFCYFGTRFMKKREPFNLDRPLKWWNLFLSVFSFIGMLRVAPHLLYMLYKWGFEVSICSPPAYTCGHGATGLWMALFTYSKYFELLDTVFLILRKRQLTFLHWYHHVTVLLYTWDGYSVEQPAGIYFIAMNYTVHAAMYLYYFLAAQLRRPLSWGVYVTVAQISQMFVGVGVTCVSLYYSFALEPRGVWRGLQYLQPSKHGHYIDRRNLCYGLLMYSTYFYLFADYFFRRYVLKKYSKQSQHARKAHKLQ
ncbi:UNVERIFIED_CONTAM: hypothetical protein H355_002100 [Colinus virginianus]|nr:hypothetical protein H355_002100 [Colinus virginianus]